MEFRYLAEPAATAPVDLLAFAVFGDPGRDPLFRVLNEALGNGLAEAAKSESFEGKSQQSLVLWTHGRLRAKRIMALGLGNRDEVSASNLRDCAAAAAQMSNRVGAATTALVVPNLGGTRLVPSIQWVVEGVLQGMYKFSRYLTAEDAR